MDVDEAGQFFTMNPKIIQDYEKMGLLKVCETATGKVDIRDADMYRLSLIRTMLDSGADVDHVKRFLNLWDENRHKTEQIQILKKQRFQVLDAIHAKQQLLDRIDFIIRKIQREDA